jgi:hypothetical protein
VSHTNGAPAWTDPPGRPWFFYVYMTGWVAREEPIDVEHNHRMQIFSEPLCVGTIYPLGAVRDPSGQAVRITVRLRGC